ncbi:unnamed protein product [Pylaiella littoralis]
MTTINIIVIYHWRVPSFRLSTCAVGPWEREALTAKNEAKPGGYLVAKMADHMMVTYREKAEKWIQQAERAQRRVYLGPLVRFKFQDSSNYLELAGQCFRVAKRFQDAGVAYKQCGRLEEKLNNPEVAASFHHEAALCFQKDDPQEAAACYLSAINLFCQTQRFSTAARLECEVAGLMHNNRNYRQAIVHHIKAADFYRANTCFDEAADRCLLKASHPSKHCGLHASAAHALGLAGNYVEAATLFQQVGRRMLVDDLLKFNAPDTFLKAVLCLQCASGLPNAVPKGLHRKSGPEASTPQPTINSVKATIVALGKASPVFQGSRAYMFATDMVSSEKEGDVDFFASRLYAYNNVCRLDAWYLRVLKTISDHVHTKAAELRKIRAIEDKRRRRQRAEERARSCISRLQNPSLEDDPSEGSLSDSMPPPSSEDSSSASTESATKSTPSSSPSSSSGSASDSDSSSDTSGSSSGSGSGSGSGSSSGSGSGSSSGSGSGSGSGSSSESPLSSPSGGSTDESDEPESGASETPATKASGRKGSGGSGGRKSPTETGSSFSSAGEESYSRNSSRTSVEAQNKKKKKTKNGSAKMTKGKTPALSEPAESDSAPGSAGFSGGSEGGPFSGSTEDSRVAKKKQDKKQKRGAGD